jgi:hypothetical protein
VADDLKGVWSVLKEIKDELRSVDDKWEEHIRVSSADSAKLTHLVTSVDHLERILTRGNGQKPVLSQLEGLHHDVANLREDHRVLKRASGVRTPEEEAAEHKKVRAEAAKAKWVAVAKIAGVLLIAIPGLLAWLGVGG